jgi:hypothetical protein
VNEYPLTGLDGSNPLAFLAALGVLRVLTDRGHAARLRWVLAGRWAPVLAAELDREALLDLLDDDRRAWAREPALQLSYSKEGGPGETRDLKPRPADGRAWLEGLLASGSPRSLAQAFFTETAQDNNGNTKPTALHFTAGQQQFLAMALDLQADLLREDLEEALYGPWRYVRELPVFGWDATAARDYALRASNPSTDKKTGVPGADWLALMGLAFLPVSPVGDRVRTPGCSGGWKDGSFRWPLWTVPVSAPTVRSLLSLRGLEEMDEPERRARGIGAVYRSEIRRSDQGGYGSFRPGRVV